MKIRADFVTNSSSSSFIIAKKSGTSCEIIDNYVEMLKSTSIKDFVMANSFTCRNDTLEEVIDNIARDVSHVLYYSSFGLSLDSWDVHSMRVSNEDNLYGMYLYSCGLPNTDWLKTKTMYD